MLALLASGPAITAAQQRPDLSGEWALEEPSGGDAAGARGNSAARTGTMGNGWGSPLTIAQDASRLVVSYPFFSAYDLEPPLRFVYALDGSESRNAVTIGHSESHLRSRAAWRDSTLVITTVYPTPDLGDGKTTTEVRQALTLASSQRLIVETTRAGVRGGPPSVTRTAYRKR